MVTFTITEIMYFTFGIFFGGYAIKAVIDFLREIDRQDNSQSQKPYSVKKTSKR